MHDKEKPEISTGHILYLPHSSEVIEAFSFTIWAGEQAGKDPHLNCHPIKMFLGWFVLQSNEWQNSASLALLFIWAIFASSLLLSTLFPSSCLPYYAKCKFFLALSYYIFPIYLAQSFLLAELILFLCTMLPECSLSPQLSVSGSWSSPRPTTKIIPQIVLHWLSLNCRASYWLAFLHKFTNPPEGIVCTSSFSFLWAQNPVPGAFCVANTRRHSLCWLHYISHHCTVIFPMYILIGDRF